MNKLNDKIGHFPRQLEDESIYIMREVAAQFERPALLFSGGKDSITLVRLAQKAFYPGKIPFPLVHIDTDITFPKPSNSEIG
jgi:sulfate adenylyltransferase subunit 2